MEAACAHLSDGGQRRASAVARGLDPGPPGRFIVGRRCFESLGAGCRHRARRRTGKRRWLIAQATARPVYPSPLSPRLAGLLSGVRGKCDEHGPMRIRGFLKLVPFSALLPLGLAEGKKLPGMENGLDLWVCVCCCRKMGLDPQVHAGLWYRGSRV